MHLYLIGYRGSGKSTIARLLAEALSRQAVDTDELIESSAGTSIRHIFETQGEAGFRDLEQSVIAEVAQTYPPSVVALGGGAILREANRVCLAGSGRCVWLQASPEHLFHRIQADATTAERRPNLSDRGGFEEVAALLREREPLYRQLAQKKVSTESKTPDEIVAEILDWVASQR